MRALGELEHGIAVDDLAGSVVANAVGDSDQWVQVNANMQPPFKSAARASHAGEEMLYVLSGQIGIRMNGEEILLNQGDCLYFSSDSQHEVRSIGNRKAEALVVIAAPHD